MKATVAFGALRDTVIKVKPLVALPLMADSVKISTPAKGKGVTIAAIAPEQAYAAVTLPTVGDTPHSHGAVCVPREALNDALRAIRPRVATADVAVTLHHDGDTLRVIVDGRESKITELRAVKDFPMWPVPATIARLAVGTVGELGDMLWSVAVAASDDTTIPMLTQVNLSTPAGSGRLRIAATDRYRAHIGTWPNADGAAITANVGMAQRDLASALTLLRGLARDDEDMTLWLMTDHRGVMLEAGGVRVYLPNHEAFSDFPKVWALLPDVNTSTTVATVDTYSTYEAWERCKRDAKSTRATKGPVLFAPHRDGCVIATHPEATVSWGEVFDVTLDASGEPMWQAPNGDPAGPTFGTVGRYMADALAGVRGPTATLRFTTSTKPIVVEGEDFHGLVMPVRFTWSPAMDARIADVANAPRGGDDGPTVKPRKSAAPKAPKSGPSGSTRPTGGRPTTKTPKSAEGAPTGTPDGPPEKRRRGPTPTPAQDKEAARRLRDVAADDPDSPIGKPRRDKAADRARAAANAFAGNDINKINARRRREGKGEATS